jgi:hypothetical protein
MMSYVVLSLNDMDSRMYGQLQMSMPISQTFGLSGMIIQWNSRNSLLINRSTLLSFSTILRKSPFIWSFNCSDWGRDTQIIVDLVLSPDRTFGNKTRLAKQARDGTGTAIILSA